MKKIILAATALIAVLSVNANAERPTRNEEAKLEAAAQEDSRDYDDASPAVGNPNVAPYQATDGETNYNDRGLSNYQDPYAANPRAYKSNEYGDAAPAPKVNVFSEMQEPSYHDDSYAPGKVKTKQYVVPAKKRSAN